MSLKVLDNDTAQEFLAEMEKSLVKGPWWFWWLFFSLICVIAKLGTRCK